MPYKEYKIVSTFEERLGTIFLGASGIPVKELESTLNQEASSGWQMIFQIIKQKRMFLFWTRETVLLTLGR